MCKIVYSRSIRKEFSGRMTPCILISERKLPCYVTDYESRMNAATLGLPKLSSVYITATVDSLNSKSVRSETKRACKCQGTIRVNLGG